MSAAEPPAVVERPLRLGELLAEAVRIYGRRLWAALVIGLVVAAGFILAGEVHAAIGVAVVALAFTVSYAFATCLVAGDGVRDAWARVGRRLPMLLVLAFVVAVPFALAMAYLVLMLVAVGWLALTGFSIPIAMVEAESTSRNALERLAGVIGRAVALARVEFVHVAGVAAALVVVYLLIGILLAGALVGFADSGRSAAFVLVQLVLAPFFFIGLSVLYFEQKTRALSSADRTS